MNIWDFERLLFIGGDEIALLLLFMVMDLVSVICIGSGGIGGNGHFFFFSPLFVMLVPLHCLTVPGLPDYWLATHRTCT